MKIANVHDATHWFEVLQTSQQSQTAVMKLKADGESSEDENIHEKSDQVLFVVEGDVEGEIAGKKFHLKKGDSVIVPAGTPHRFINTTAKDALTFSVYTPPGYPADEKG